MKPLRAFILAMLLLAAGAMPGDTDPLRIHAPAAVFPRERGAFTFFAWSDQHVGADGDAQHLLPALQAMRGLPGTAWPPEIDSAVDRPLFIFSAGDCTDWPTRKAAHSYARAVSWLEVPHLEVLGNHDEGDGSTANPMRQRILARHGGLSYRFDCAGVTFLNLFSPYDDSQHLTGESLAWLRAELAKLEPGRPVIVATHLSLAAIRNPDDLVDAFGAANVILILGGHLHRTRVMEHRGHRFLQLPSPKATHEVVVIRIDAERLLALPYDYRRKAWNEDPARRIDVSLTQTGHGKP